METTRLVGTSQEVTRLLPRNEAQAQKLKKSQRVILAAAIRDESARSISQISYRSYADYKAITSLKKVCQDLEEAFHLQPVTENKFYLALALSDLGDRTRGKRGVALLQKSIRLAATLPPKFKDNLMGLTKTALGVRLPGKKGAKLLRDAKEQLLKAANKTKNNIVKSNCARTTVEMARRTPGRKGIHLLREALRICDDAQISESGTSISIGNLAFAQLELGTR